MHLRTYQEEDVTKMVQHECVGNFSEQRTGKTPTTCVSLLRRNKKHVLIVCPASLMYVWKAQWELWTNGNAFVLPTTSYDLSTLPYDTAVIVNFEKLRGTSKQQQVLKALLEWKPEAVVVDEAHRMKDRKSLTAQALNKFNKVPIRIALTGTPATNKPWDVWSILHWLFPKQYNSFWTFVKQYFEEEVIWVAGEPRRQPARFKRGMEKILQMNLDVNCIQRKRREVMTWLEEDNEPTKVLLPTNKQQQAALDGLMNYFEYKGIVTQTVLDNLVRVRQVCAAPAILDLKGKSPKLEWLQEYLKDYPEKHILVFSNSKKFLYYLSKNIKTPHAIICGDVSPKQRVEIVNKFQTKQLPLLLLQTQACKEGLTLDEADVSIFLDTYPPAADYLQAKDRMIAVSEERNKPKELIHVMMKDTYDEKTFELVKNNISESAVINDYKQYLNERRNSDGEQKSKRSS